MQSKQPISIIVPTLNEAENITPLVRRIDATLTPAGIAYEVIIVDDHSIDETLLIADTLAKQYPLQTVLKRGERGKAYSLLEGFQYANYELVAMIDADLQYPPEELLPMYRLLTQKHADVVVTSRDEQQTTVLRRLSTKVFSLVFAKLLFGINYDTQSGLKLFRKPVLDNLDMTPSPWSFDLEFIVRALENKFKIINHSIVFNKRLAGMTKVNLLKVTLELISASLKLRFRTSIRKVWAGYRANNLFIKQTFPLLLAAIGLSVVSNPAKSQALDLPASQLSTITTQSGKELQLAVTTATANGMGGQSSGRAVNGSLSTPASPTTTMTTAAQTTSLANSLQPATRQTSTANQSSPITINTADASSITNGRPTNAYANPFTPPSTKIVDLLRTATRLGIITGIVVGSLGLALTVRSSYNRFRTVNL